MRIVVVLLALLALLPGCVRRTISITSDPDGALVYLNDREIGRTPVQVDFVHYGTYDVRLVKDGYQALLTSGDAKSPLWDTMPLDLAAEAVPGQPHSQIHWHYVLLPVDDDPGRLAERARQMRATIPTPTAQDSGDNAPLPAATGSGTSADSSGQP